ncbi:MAG: hypothetical protein COB49_10625 [Alphaproteobacteria bacterium]|nr:MAG: hypothetical protein COB49_10625 [Alphaproteobacteria bacterium]
MRKMNHKFIKSSLMGLAGWFLLFPLSGSTQQSSNAQKLSDVQQIVAVVNDSPISLYDLKQRVRLFMMSSGARQLSGQEQQYFNQQALQSLIDDKLKTQEAEKYKTVISKDEQEESFASYAQQMRLTPKQLEEQLDKSGVRKESMLQQVEATLAWDQVVGGLLMPQVSISDEEIYLILDRMKNNKGQYEYHPLEIFLLVSDNDKREEGRIAAHRIVEQLRNKTSFQVMARQFSQSTTSAVGGDLGWLMKSQLSPEIVTALETMETGDISEPIETEDGFYILQLAGKRQVLTPNEMDARVDLQHLFFEVSDKAQSEELLALEKIVAIAAAKIENCDNLEEQGKELGAKETGSLGNLAISDLPKNLHKIILNLEIGHATGPIKEENGYRVFVVCDRKDPVMRLPDYDSVEGSLSQQRVGLIARRHLRDLRRDAIIDYK